MVTPIGAILKAATGDTMKSPGHGGFFSLVTESRRCSRRLKTVTGSKASHFKRNACDPFYFIYAVVTRTRVILRCGHRVTAKFRRTQIVSRVAALSIAPMGVTTPWTSKVIISLSLPLPLPLPLQATELFIGYLARKSHVFTVQGKRKTIQRRDIDACIPVHDELNFLEGTLDS